MKNHLPSLTLTGRSGCTPTPEARLMPHRARNGAAPNRADSQGTGLADGEASDEIPLRGVRGPTLDTKNRRSQKTEGLNQSHISGLRTSRAAPARTSVHGGLTPSAQQLAASSVVRRNRISHPKGSGSPHANSAPRGPRHRQGPGLPPQPQRPSRQQQFFAWTTRCSRAPRRARRPGRTNSS